MQRKRFFAILSAAALIVVVILTSSIAATAADYTALYKFRHGKDGRYPLGVTLDSAGNVYVSTVKGGGHGNGSIVRLTQNPDGSWSEKLIFVFSGGDDGGTPNGGLIFDAAGNLYGTTQYGGSDNKGTAFRLSPNPDGTWTESVLHSFTKKTGKYPAADLVFDAAGNLYGSALVGGAHYQGLIFRLSPNPDGSWTETVLYDFMGQPDGSFPASELTFDAAGNLYGVTFAGGTSRYGTVFELTPQPAGTWTETVLHSFSGGKDGSAPATGLVFDTQGSLYGTTDNGGRFYQGTVFQLSPAGGGTWTETLVHVFKGMPGASQPASTLVLINGNLYGMAYTGGPYNAGTLFKLSPEGNGAWTINTVHIFKGKDGSNPYGGLAQDSIGNLYGSTIVGGKGHGLVFKITF